MTYPPKTTGVGTGGGTGGTHIYADLSQLIEGHSLEGERFALLATLNLLVGYADAIRDTHPDAYHAAAAALKAGTQQLEGMFGVQGARSGQQ